MATIMLDTETTSLDTPKIIQFGGVLLDGKDITIIDDMFHPGKYRIAAEAMEKHDITPEMLTDKPELAKTHLKKLQTYIDKGDKLVAYNAKFDIGALEFSGVTVSSEAEVIDVYDFVLMYCDLYENDFTKLSLKYIVYKTGLYKSRPKIKKWLGITKELNSHDAISDVIDMILLVKWLESKTGMSMDEMAVEARNYVLETIPFGYQKGLPFEEATVGTKRFYRGMDNPCQVLQNTIDTL